MLRNPFMRPAPMAQYDTILDELNRLIEKSTDPADVRALKQARAIVRGQARKHAPEIFVREVMGR